MFDSDDLIEIMTGKRPERLIPVWDMIEKIWLCRNCRYQIEKKDNFCWECKTAINWNWD